MLETRERAGLIVMLALLLVCASLLLAVLGMPELFVVTPEPEPEPEAETEKTLALELAEFH